MRILVTGGGGFIGTYAVRDFLDHEDYEIFVYELTNDRSFHEAIIPLQDRKRVYWETGDITVPFSFERVLRDYQIQKVVHLAYSLPQGSETDPSQVIQFNCEGTNSVFQTCLKLGIEKVVWGSSIEVFGSPDEYNEEILSANSPPKPHTIYGACKAFNEFLADYYLKKGLNNIGLRFCAVYGPGGSLVKGSEDNCFVTDLIENSVLGLEWVSIPYGDDTVNWLHVEDASRAVCLALKDESSNGVYTICGDYRPLRQVATYVKSLVPEAKIRLQEGYRGLCWRHDMKKAMEGIGYLPEYSIEQGVRKYIDYIQNNKRNNLGHNNSPF